MRVALVRQGLGSCSCHGCTCDGCPRCTQPEPQPADLPTTPVSDGDPWVTSLTRPAPF